MKKRKLPLGDRNMIGARVTEARNNIGMKQVELLTKLQTAGIEISIPVRQHAKRKVFVSPETLNILRHNKEKHSF